MKFSYKGVLAVTLTALVVSACGSNKEQVHQSHASSGDLRETTASADILPTFLKGQSEQIRLVYETAGKAADILKWMPCYCGCGESAGHTSNLNCFIHQVNEDGSIVWDDHGTRCDVCLQIAAKAVTMKLSGKTLKEIRTSIDNTYGKGYAKPTDTPMPA